MKNLTLSSPAKINLFLNVLERLPDGYHRIETLFERISLSDEISLETTLDGSIEVAMECPGPEIKKEENIAFKAALILKETYKVAEGARIRIKKRIPVGAGLAGGSSNAASVLKGLAGLWSLDIKNKELMNIGRVLGADVPFFIMDSARAVGREKGDELESIFSDSVFWYVIISPNIIVKTKDIYEGYDANFSLTTTSKRLKLLIYAIQNNDIGSISRLVYNGLEGVTDKVVREVNEIKNLLLKQGVPCVLMSGSGPTVFGVCENESKAVEITDRLKAAKSDWFIECAHTLL